LNHHLLTVTYTQALWSNECICTDERLGALGPAAHAGSYARSPGSTPPRLLFPQAWASAETLRDPLAVACDRPKAQTHAVGGVTCPYATAWTCAHDEWRYMFTCTLCARTGSVGHAKSRCARGGVNLPYSVAETSMRIARVETHPLRPFACLLIIAWASQRALSVHSDHPDARARSAMEARLIH